MNNILKSLAAVLWISIPFQVFAALLHLNGLYLLTAIVSAFSGAYFFALADSLYPIKPEHYLKKETTN